MLVLIVSLIAPQPARAQFGIDWGAIVAAINSIGTAISNTIGPALRAINGALGTLNNLMSSIQAFFTNIVYPQAAINRARGLVGAIQGLYTQIQVVSRVNVASATLANPQQLEQVLLSRNPMNVPSVTANYQTLYQTVPVPQNASPQTRDLIDMSDAAARCADTAAECATDGSAWSGGNSPRQGRRLRTQDGRGHVECGGLMSACTGPAGLRSTEVKLWDSYHAW